VDGGKTLQLKILDPKADLMEPKGDIPISHRFELYNVPPALALVPCTNSSEVDESRSGYAGDKLMLSVHVSVQSGFGCVHGVKVAKSCILYCFLATFPCNAA
jgi:hypothetical protein